MPPGGHSRGAAPAGGTCGGPLQCEIYCYFGLYSPQSFRILLSTVDLELNSELDSDSNGGVITKLPSFIRQDEYNLANRQFAPQSS
jgi:hypothetical protein